MQPISIRKHSKKLIGKIDRWLRSIWTARTLAMIFIYLQCQLLPILTVQAAEPAQPQWNNHERAEAINNHQHTHTQTPLNSSNYRPQEQLQEASSLEIQHRNSEAKHIYRQIIGEESQAMARNTSKMRALAKLTRILLNEGQEVEARRKTDFLLAHAPHTMRKEAELSVDIDDLANSYLFINCSGPLKLTHLEYCYKLRQANFGNHPLMGESCRLLAKENVHMGHLSTAEKWQLKAINYDVDLPKEKKSIEIVDRFMLTQIYTNSGQVEKAATESRLTLKLCQQYNCANQYRCIMQFQIARAYASKGQYKEALEYYKKAETDGKRYPFEKLDISTMCQKAIKELEALQGKKIQSHSISGHLRKDGRT